MDTQSDQSSGSGRATDGTRSSQVATGLLLIALGLLFFADRQGWAWGWRFNFSTLWPVILIALGVTKIVVPYDETITDAATGNPGIRVRRYRLGSGFWLSSVGVLLLLHVNHVLRLDQSWPLFIVLGGLSLMFGDNRRSRRRRKER